MISNAPTIMMGVLVLFSFGGAVLENAAGVSPRGQDTVVITRNGSALSGVMRLNGTDVPLANVKENNGSISFSTTFPVSLASTSHLPGASQRSDDDNDSIAQSTSLGEAATVAQKSVAEPLPTILEDPSFILPPEPTRLPLTALTSTPPISVTADPAATLQTPLPLGRRYGGRNRNSRITLRVHRPTRVAVQGTRNRIFIDRALSTGDTYRVPNVAGLRLIAPDAGAVEIILDGSSVGFAGEDGVTARGLSLNLQTIIDRQQRG